MTMLSRVAERLYWMARYLERAEDMARLTNAYTHMAMDIPKGAEPGWDVLVRIMDAEAAYTDHYRVYNEQNVLKFIIADEDNVGGIYNAIRAVRENVRTTRDVLPEEAWEYVNELYIYAQEHADKSIGRRNRYKFLETVITSCQMISGMLSSTLSRDHAYRFIKLGRLLERADMTTRIIDVGAAALLGEDRHHTTVDPLIWASLLKSLSAMGAYRRMIGPQVEANDVVDFVLRNETLPRSVKFCLNGMREELIPLTNHKPVVKLLDRARRKQSGFDPYNSTREQLHTFVDEFQASLFNINRTIDSTWFQQDQT
ncbi:alpha-E domain-containing protein [Oceanicoccus sp. KOV_DT_Chl]|uniref:alpha-E domain-containing protein n=1 Tax=Oceanicoccus sp. KOV_DT_Chl TaxID=1904639 RepID=UPI000C7BFDCE|nr:alpha-E domain-containing protein [Oceanicoccus sp. KOV_DT_Chl]